MIGSATAADVSAVALTQGKAVLIIDGGRPRTVAVGEVTPENVKLISATSDEAVVEIDGRRRTVPLGGRISIGPAESGRQQAMLTADANGHF
ncbi:MAG: TIGR02281 family clan AA aspartic protease, partial [Betaproteobacteria bacterium]|nr:TIGR02281 family clan AA aspartic protease [Betaproteobacteria bacterium]